MLYYVALLQSFLTKSLEKRNDRGATAVEYGLMVAAIVAVVITLAFTLGDYVVNAFTDTNTAWEVEAPLAPAAP